MSEWADHQRAYRGGSPSEKANRWLDSPWFRTSHQLKQAAWSKLSADSAAALLAKAFPSATWPTYQTPTGWSPTTAGLTT